MLHGHEKAVSSILFDRQNPMILISGSDDCSVKFWDLKTLQCLRTIHTSYVVNHFCESPEDGMLCLPSKNASAEFVCAWDVMGRVYSSQGVPLTLLAMTRDTEFGVVEMGASACGELALLASVAEPNYGILTNIGLAHLEGFGGPEGVRRGKGELFDFLAANGGHAFVPADDEILTGMAAERDSLAVEYYSASLADGIENHLEGSYNRFNIAAAVAVGHYFDVPDERIRHAIASYVPDNNRSQRIGTSRNTLVADCYNANPSSMRASVGNFLAEPLEERQRRVLILGDMLELGDWSEREHAAIIEMAAQDPEAELLLVGPEFAKAYDGLAEKPANVTLCPTRDDLISLLKVSPVEHSLVLVKGSHGMGLEQALEAL